MYSIEINGSFVRQSPNRKAALQRYRSMLREINANVDIIRLWWNGMVIMSNDNEIYNCNETDE